MKNTISILILILIGTQVFAQKNKNKYKIKREYISVYIGTYTKDTIVLEGLLEPPKINYYDIDGNILSSTAFTLKNEDKDQKYSYKYGITLFDEEEMDTFFYYSYQYENGLLISKTYSDKDNNIKNYTSFVYKKSGDCITKTECDSPNVNCDSVWEYSYNRKGDVISEILRENGIIKKENKISNTYKRRKLISREIHKFKEGELASIEKYQNNNLISVQELFQGWNTTYTYYESGEEKTWTKDFGDEKSVMHTWIERNKQGHPIVRTWVGADGYGEIKIIGYDYY